MISPLAMFPLGDSAVLIKLGDVINKPVHLKVQAVAQFVQDHPFPGFTECIPSFTTVSIHYDLLQVREVEESGSPFDYVCTLLNEYLNQIEQLENSAPVVMDIPVCYGGDYGPDLDDVAAMNKLTPEQVIEIHCGQAYLIHALGFAPGFPYLGGMSERIAVPRRSTPRLMVPSGSVGIAGNQTGIYPIESPGGWQIIGRTPLALFRPEHHPPTLLEGGQYIRFRQIDQAEYELILKGGDL